MPATGCPCPLRTTADFVKKKSPRGSPWKVGRTRFAQQTRTTSAVTQPRRQPTHEARAFVSVWRSAPYVQPLCVQHRHTYTFAAPRWPLGPVRGTVRPHQSSNISEYCRRLSGCASCWSTDTRDTTKYTLQYTPELGQRKHGCCPWGYEDDVNR